LNLNRQKRIKKFFFNKPKVILGEIMLASFFKSANAANGRPQLATGPQKCFYFNQLINLYKKFWEESSFLRYLN